MATKTHEIETAKSAADIEQLQIMDWGLFVPVDDVTPYAVDDQVTLTTSDGEVFAGCYVYEIGAGRIGVGVS